MRLMVGSTQVPGGSPRRGRGARVAASLLAAAALGLSGFLAAGLAAAGPAIAANQPVAAKATATLASTPTPEPTEAPQPTEPPEPTEAPQPTMSPFVSGRHVYDYGNVLPANLATQAETLAADIEARGGGRVVVYTTAQPEDMPDTLAQDWQVNGMLMTGSEESFGELSFGSVLKAKLSKAQLSAVDTTPGPQTMASWMMSSLARVDAFLAGTHVFDGTGILDAAGKQKAEAAATALSGKIGAPVYIDIALGNADPSSAAFFNGADLSSDFDSALIIALGVHGTQIAGYIQTDNSDLWESYHNAAPWQSDTLADEAAPGGDVQAALLGAIEDVQSGSSSGPGGLGVEFWFWVVFAIVMVIVGVGSPFYGGWLIRKITGVSGPAKGGLPGDAIIESIADTGTTVSMPGVGPEAPEYKFGMQVTPAGGGAPYNVEAKAFVPRLYIPMVVPGAHVGVVIDPTDPQKVSIDFSQMGGGPAAAGATPSAGPGGMGFEFDASGQPAAGEVGALMGAVRSGTMPLIKGSADQLLATGTHGTAVITTASPMGKTVRDINPNADPSRLDDPMWLFTVQVSVAGEAPFPAVFGHRVPLGKVVSVAPGVKLAIAVDMSDRNEEVAIDWDKSPIS